MELHIPDSYIEIDRQQFLNLLDGMNWEREAYSNGENFYAKGREWRMEQRYADGRVITEMQKLRVAIHTADDRHYIDPTFYKPAR